MKTDGKDASSLIKNISPELNEGEYVFCSVKDPEQLEGINVIYSFREKESVTAIMPKKTAESKGFPFAFTAAWITLNVYSPLDSVGFTALFANALAKEGIGCNVVAGYYHDHVFVPYADAERAMKTLASLMEKPAK